MNNEENIIDWIIANEGTIKDLTLDLVDRLNETTFIDPEFEIEIENEFKEAVNLVIGEEISRQLGLSIDIIFEALENIEVQDYLYDSIRSNS